MSVSRFCAVCATERRFTEGESSYAVAKQRKSQTNLDLAEFIRERGFKTYAALLDIAEEWRTDSQMGMAELFFKRNENIFRELKDITKTWQKVLARGKQEATKLS